MDCAQIREHLLKGLPADAEMARHAENCSVCRELLADSGRTARAMVQPPESPPALAALLTSVNASIASERGARGALRSLPTQWRWVLATAAAVLTTAVVCGTRPRVDLGVYPWPRMALVVALLLVALAAAIRLSLWPLQLPVPRARTVWGITAIAILAPVLCAALPAAHGAHHASLHGTGHELVDCAARCFLAGLALGAPLLLLLRALDRSTHSVPRSALIAAAAVGVSSNLALQLHCPLTAPGHLLLGHATIGVVAMALYGTVALRRR